MKNPPVPLGILLLSQYDCIDSLLITILDEEAVFAVTRKA